MTKTDNDSNNGTSAESSFVTFYLTINKIANIRREYNTTDILILDVYHNNKLLQPHSAKSNKIHINSNGHSKEDQKTEINETFKQNNSDYIEDEIISLDLNYIYNLNIQQNTIEELRHLVDSPLFFILYQDTLNKEESKEKTQISDDDTKNLTKIKNNGKESKFTSSENQSKIKRKKKTDGNKNNNENASNEKNINKIKNNDTQTMNKKSNELMPVFDKKVILGCGYLEFFPIIKSKSKDFKEIVFLYPTDILSSLQKKTTYIDLTLKIDENFILTDDNINLVTFTLESIFNIPKNIINNKNLNVNVTFSVLYPSNETHKNEDENKKKLFEFINGNLEKFNENSNCQYKKWNSLPNIKGLGTRTNQYIKKSLIDVYNLNPNFLNEILKNNDTIYAFNSIHRSLIHGKFYGYFVEFLCEKNEHLLIEVNFQTTNNNYDDNENNINIANYIGYVDLSPLLYPEGKK